MTPPKDFTAKLKQEFPDLRIRWSKKQSSWQIEQKVGRGALAPFRLNETDDRYIRARDGFWLVCQVTPGDRIPCPECFLPLSVPHLSFKEVKCENCVSKGKDGRVSAGFFPLSTALLEHLRETDPRRDAIRKMAEKADKANALLMEQKARERHNEIEAITLDYFNEMFAIQSVGYSGKEKAWVK
jgi:hypothetical protein